MKSKSIKSRRELLVEKLRGRTDHEGRPLRGYGENVAQIRAELAMLDEHAERIAARDSDMEIKDGE